MSWGRSSRARVRLPLPWTAAHGPPDGSASLPGLTGHCPCWGVRGITGAAVTSYSTDYGQYQCSPTVQGTEVSGPPQGEATCLSQSSKEDSWSLPRRPLLPGTMKEMSTQPESVSRHLLLWEEFNQPLICIPIFLFMLLIAGPPQSGNGPACFEKHWELEKEFELLCALFPSCIQITVSMLNVCMIIVIREFTFKKKYEIPTHIQFQELRFIKNAEDIKTSRLNRESWQ